MPKRKRTGTSSTWDKHPQWLHITCTQTGSDATTTTTVNLPREVFSAPNTPTIIEILGVYFDWTAASNAAPEVDSRRSCFITTSNHGTTGQTPGALDLIAWNTEQFALTTSGDDRSFYPFFFNCTPDCNGILVATDNIYVQVWSTGTGISNTAYIKILYRYVRVGLSEYVGILQSQQ